MGMPILHTDKEFYCLKALADTNVHVKVGLMSRVYRRIGWNVLGMVRRSRCRVKDALESLHSITNKQYNCCVASRVTIRLDEIRLDETSSRKLLDD